MCCDLMNTDKLCQDSIYVEDTGQVSKENAPVPATSDFRVILLGGPF
jgi:hypothetical protein